MLLNENIEVPEGYFCTICGEWFSVDSTSSVQDEKGFSFCTEDCYVQFLVQWWN